MAKSRLSQNSLTSQMMNKFHTFVFSSLLPSLLLHSSISLVSSCTDSESSLTSHVSHTPFLETNEDIVVTWTTLKPTDSSLVEYGREEIDQTAQGTSVKFVDGGSEGREMWIHRVTLSSLQPDTMYSEFLPVCLSCFGDQTECCIVFCYIFCEQLENH